MSVPSIAESLFATRDDMTDEEKLKEGQKIHDSLMKGFPTIANAIANSQKMATQCGYTETILGRRRHHPNMQLPRFEFVPMPGYVNPDIDPLDPESLKNKEQIPTRIVAALTKEFNGYKWYGKIVKRTKELAEQKIKVINNTYKIEEASRQCFNCVTKDTEILTTSGWKSYAEVQEGDQILSYSMDSHQVELDEVLKVHIYDEAVEVVNFSTPSFSASSTPEHRWVVQDSGEPVKIKTTANIEKNLWPDYPIVRVADNSFHDNPGVSDDDLRMIGWIVTDASVSGDCITLYQSTNRTKNEEVYRDMISMLDKYNLTYNDRVYDHNCHHIYINVCDRSRYWCKFVNNSDRILSFEFVSALSQRQAEILMRSMLSGDGDGVDSSGNRLEGGTVTPTFTCGTREKADVFQYLAFRAGYATNLHEVTPEEHNAEPSSSKTYASVSNNVPIKVNKSYFHVSVLSIKRAQIYPSHKSRTISSDGVWCVTTRNQTWVARHKGHVFITGNSVIQGSASDLTKMAILNLENDKEWKEIGGRFIIPVHDELICEVPLENAEKGAEVLSRCMCDAGSFFPFGLSCDVETTYRWYGLGIDDVMSREKPTSLDWDEMSISNIEWIQCMLIENEYLLPVFKEEDGSKPSGVRAQGVNGRITDELLAAVEDYKNRYHIENDAMFLDHIEAKVIRGVY